MAVLSKIRKRSGLLLLAIGFALLAFVIQDIFNSGMKSISTDVGSVNGKDISFEEFRIKEQEFQEPFKFSKIYTLAQYGKFLG